MNEKYNIFELKEIHKNLIVKFISFFKSKEEKFVKEMKHTINDFKDSNLKEMIYSQSDLCEMFEKLKGIICQNMEKELDYYVNMNAIYVQLLLHDADNQTVSLKVETSQVENLHNINEMNEFIKNLSISNENQKSIVSKLNSISKTQNLISDFEDLKHEFEILTQNNNILKNQNEMLIKENENLHINSKIYINELNDIKSKIKSNQTSTLHSTEKDLEITKKKLDQQIESYQKLLKEYDVKLNESIQFQQMKKLLHDKNKLITELKSKLAVYEEK